MCGGVHALRTFGLSGGGGGGVMPPVDSQVRQRLAVAR
ncbi:hypothetical protein XAP412_200035 [Xanthomonas phaseoli pv. phaseoli]|nr:hypothetical protein XAP412_200035 [Xanthomonas phaseoli pv. phaseoli]